MSVGQRPLGKTHFWTQEGPNCVALKTVGAHEAAGFGDVHLLSPETPAPKGMPKKKRAWSVTRPRTGPFEVETMLKPLLALLDEGEVPVSLCCLAALEVNTNKQQSSKTRKRRILEKQKTKQN